MNISSYGLTQCYLGLTPPFIERLLYKRFIEHNILY